MFGWIIILTLHVEPPATVTCVSGKKNLSPVKKLDCNNLLSLFNKMNGVNIKISPHLFFFLSLEKKNGLTCLSRLKYKQDQLKC